MAAHDIDVAIQQRPGRVVMGHEHVGALFPGIRFGVVDFRDGQEFKGAIGLFEAAAYDVDGIPHGAGNGAGTQGGHVAAA